MNNSKGQWGQLPLKFSLSENFLLVRKFLFENTEFGAKYPILHELTDKIEILSTHNVFCRKFVALCQEIAIFCPSYLLNA